MFSVFDCSWYHSLVFCGALGLGTFHLFLWCFLVSVRFLVRFVLFLGVSLMSVLFFRGFHGIIFVPLVMANVLCLSP